jgi:inosose dehydratase
MRSLGRENNTARGEDMIRIGTNPIAWSNDDLRSLGGATPLETCLREAREAGYEGIELGHKFPRAPAALQAALAPHGLDLVSGWYSAALLERTPEAEMAAMRPHLDLLRAMGCTVLIIAETSNAVHGDRAVPLSRRPRLHRAQWPRYGAALTRLAELVAAEGMRLAWHHHMGTIVQEESEIDRLMQVTGDALGLLLDTGHATFAGGDPVALAARHASRIVHVHAKDVRATVMREALARDWSFLDAVVAGVYTVPGDGMVDFTAVFTALPGYDGWVVVEAEQDPEKANPLDYARRGRHALANALQRATLLRDRESV